MNNFKRRFTTVIFPRHKSWPKIFS